MKRKRNDKEEAPKIREFLNRDELLVFTTQLQLEFNRCFKLNNTNLELYRYVTTINNVETIYKINLVIKACISENIHKTLNEIINIAAINMPST